MELGLAEDILRDYEEIKLAIKNSRHQYIEEKVQKTKDHIKSIDLKQKRIK